MFLRNKYTVKMYLTSNRFFQLKYKSSIHNVAFSSEKCVLSESGETSAQMLIERLEWCGLLVDYCDVFISCLDSHSDGTHSLQSIHW